MKFFLSGKRNRGFVTSLLLAIVALSACNSAKQVAYFQDVADSIDVEKRVRNAPFHEPIIHKGDILNIDVTTIDANIGGVTTVQHAKEDENAGAGNRVKGYIVDKNGVVEIPIIGKLNVEGHTTMEVKEMVRNIALKYYKDPLVNVRIANFYITVLGEVKSPGMYVVANEKINIIDAIGLAGDLTLGGKRGNVIVIREENGESVFARVSLNTTDLVQSEYFYLQPGDKVYVEPLKSFAKAGTSDQRTTRIVSLMLGIVSIAVAVATLATRL